MQNKTCDNVDTQKQPTQSFEQQRTTTQTANREASQAGGVSRFSVFEWRKGQTDLQVVVRAG